MRYFILFMFSLLVFASCDQQAAQGSAQDSTAAADTVVVMPQDSAAAPQDSSNR